MSKTQIITQAHHHKNFTTNGDEYIKFVGTSDAPLVIVLDTPHESSLSDAGGEGNYALYRYTGRSGVRFNLKWGTTEMLGEKRTTLAIT